MSADMTGGFEEAIRKAIEQGATLTITQRDRYLDLPESEREIYAAIGKFVSEMADIEFVLDDFIFAFSGKFPGAAVAISKGPPFKFEEKVSFLIYAHVLVPAMRECGDLEGGLNLHSLFYGLLELYDRRNGIVHGRVMSSQTAPGHFVVDARRHRRLAKDTYVVEPLVYDSSYLENALQDIHYFKSCIWRAKRVVEGDLDQARERDELLRGQANIRAIEQIIRDQRSEEAT